MLTALTGLELACAAAGSKHKCGGVQTFSQIGQRNFLCNRCGWMHVCDVNCSERVLQRGADLPACPISGCTFDVVEAEEVSTALLAPPC